MAKAKNIQQITLTAVCVAVLAACGGGGGSSGSPNTSSTDTGAYVEEAKAANKVRLQIEAIGAADTLEVGDVAAVQAAVDAYNALSPLEKRLVPAPSLKALEDMAAAINTNAQTAADISAQLLKLPAAADVDTDAEEAQVNNARNAYDKLTDAQKTWVSPAALQHLVAIESDIRTNIASAEAFADAVAALPANDQLTKTAAKQVEMVDAAYKKMSSAQKNRVSAATLDVLANKQAAVAANEKAAADLQKSVAALPKGADIDTDAEVQALNAAMNAYNGMNDAQKSWVDAATVANLQAISTGAIFDSEATRMAALNLPTPLHTSFISSGTAQQHNPHMQLRLIDGKPALVDTQIGLIRSLVISPNAPVIVDGAVLSSDNEVGYLTPYSATTKASSAGTTQENIQSLTGAPRGVYSNVKTSLDKEIKENFDALEAAKKVLKDPEADLKARLAAQDVVDKLQPIYDQDMGRREVMESKVNTVLKDLAYIKKDKNGLVFDKAFDGVYVIQFENGTEVVIHDSAAAGWTYQTFAHYIDRTNGVLRGYQSLGDETTVAQMPVSGTATYKGITTAYLNNEQVTANVNAVADFAKKGVRFTTSDSQIHTLNGGVRTSTAADKLNMSGTASWAAGENAFKGNVATADKALSGTFNGKFYGGASVAEIGGTYGLKNADNSEQLIGGYGAKRQ